MDDALKKVKRVVVDRAFFHFVFLMFCLDSRGYLGVSYKSVFRRRVCRPSAFTPDSLHTTTWEFSSARPS